MTTLLEYMPECRECGGELTKSIDQEGYCCNGCTNRYVFYPSRDGVEEDNLLVTYEDGCKDPLLEAMKLVEELDQPFQLERIKTVFADEGTEKITWWASFDSFEKTGASASLPAKAVNDAAKAYLESVE